MCDTYLHKCCVKGCKERLPWHIADFKYPREKFKMWCQKHLLKAPGEVVFYAVATKGKWTWTVNGYDTPDEFEIWAVSGPETGDYNNHPNLPITSYRMLSRYDVEYLLGDIVD